MLVVLLRMCCRPRIFLNFRQDSFSTLVTIHLCCMIVFLYAIVQRLDFISFPLVSLLFDRPRSWLKQVPIVCRFDGLARHPVLVSYQLSM